MGRELKELLKTKVEKKVKFKTVMFKGDGLLLTVPIADYVNLSGDIYVSTRNTCRTQGRLIESLGNFVKDIELLKTYADNLHIPKEHILQLKAELEYFRELGPHSISGLIEVASAKNRPIYMNFIGSRDFDMTGINQKSTQCLLVRFLEGTGIAVVSLSRNGVLPVLINKNDVKRITANFIDRLRAFSVNPQKSKEVLKDIEESIKSEHSQWHEEKLCVTKDLLPKEIIADILIQNELFKNYYVQGLEDVIYSAFEESLKESGIETYEKNKAIELDDVVSNIMSRIMGSIGEKRELVSAFMKDRKTLREKLLEMLKEYTVKISTFKVPEEELEEIKKEVAKRVAASGLGLQEGDVRSSLDDSKIDENKHNFKIESFEDILSRVSSFMVSKINEDIFYAMANERFPNLYSYDELNGSENQPIHYIQSVFTGIMLYKKDSAIEERKRIFEKIIDTIERLKTDAGFINDAKVDELLIKQIIPDASETDIESIKRVVYPMYNMLNGADHVTQMEFLELAKERTVDDGFFARNSGMFMLTLKRVSEMMGMKNCISYLAEIERARDSFRIRDGVLEVDGEDVGNTARFEDSIGSALKNFDVFEDILESSQYDDDEKEKIIDYVMSDTDIVKDAAELIRIYSNRDIDIKFGNYMLKKGILDKLRVSPKQIKELFKIEGIDKELLKAGLLKEENLRRIMLADDGIEALYNDGIKALYNIEEIDKELLKTKAADVINIIGCYLGRTPLLNAILSRDINFVKFVLSIKGVDVNKPGKDIDNPLIIAVYEGDKDIVELLLRTDARKDILKPGRYGNTPLIVAIERQNIDVFKLLLNTEAVQDINRPDNKGNPPLIMAIKEGYTEILDMLLKLDNIDINKCDRYGNTPLACALEKDQIEIAKLLLERNADINIKNKDGETPLAWAMREGKTEIARWLIEKGADVNVKDKNGEPIYNIAFKRQGYQEIIGLMLRRGVDLNVKDKEGDTMLTWLLRNGYRRVAQKFIDMADINVAGKNGQSPLSLALNMGYGEVAELLYKRGANINAKDKFGDSILITAIRNRQEDIVNWLIERGADVNITNENGQTALIEASKSGSLKLVKLLIEKGADVNAAEYNSGNTSLMVAAKSCYTDVLKLLIEKGADVNAKNIEGKTILLELFSREAYSSGYGMMVSDEGETIQEAWFRIQSGREVVELLVKNGAELPSEYIPTELTEILSSTTQLRLMRENVNDLIDSIAKLQPEIPWERFKTGIVNCPTLTREDLLLIIRRLRSILNPTNSLISDKSTDEASFIENQTSDVHLENMLKIEELIKVLGLPIWCEWSKEREKFQSCVNSEKFIPNLRKQIARLEAKEKDIMEKLKSNPDDVAKLDRDLRTTRWLLESYNAQVSSQSSNMDKARSLRLARNIGNPEVREMIEFS